MASEPVEANTYRSSHDQREAELLAVAAVLSGRNELLGLDLIDLIVAVTKVLGLESSGGGGLSDFSHFDIWWVD